MAKYLIKQMKDHDVLEMSFKPMDVDLMRHFIIKNVFFGKEADDLEIQLLTDANVKDTKEETMDHQWNEKKSRWHIWQSPRVLEKQNHQGLYVEDFKTPHFICVDTKNEVLYVIHLACCWYYENLQRHQEYRITYDVDEDLKAELTDDETIIRNDGDYYFVGCDGYTSHFERLKEKCHVYADLAQNAFGSGYTVKAEPIMCVYNVDDNSVRDFVLH